MTTVKRCQVARSQGQKSSPSLLMLYMVCLIMESTRSVIICLFYVGINLKYFFHADLYVDLWDGQ